MADKRKVAPRSKAPLVECTMAGTTRHQRERYLRVLEIMKEQVAKHGGARLIKKVKQKAASGSIEKKFVDNVLRHRQVKNGPAMDYSSEDLPLGSRFTTIDDTKASLTPKDEKEIKELTKDPRITDKIVKSIAPSIYGYDPVKEAIALQLFGCDPKELDDGTRLEGSIHILLAGGLDAPKSALLRWAAAIDPRGAYVSCCGAAFQGIVTDKLTKDGPRVQTLETMAMILADEGIACMDNLERMNLEGVGALMDALDSRTVYVASGGTFTPRPVRAAVLAGTTLKFGALDPSVPIPEQLALDRLLLLRFDLIFIMKDEPVEERDRALAQHILQIHSGARKVVGPQIEPEFLRKIIIYARKNIHHEFDDKEAPEAIADFYTEWRKAATMQDHPLPITVRRLETLTKLAKSYARLRLSDRVTLGDATRAISLVKKSLEQAGVG